MYIYIYIYKIKPQRFNNLRAPFCMEKIGAIRTSILATAPTPFLEWPIKSLTNALLERSKSVFHIATAGEEMDDSRF